jgi:hypothetical protein
MEDNLLGYYQSLFLQHNFQFFIHATIQSLGTGSFVKCPISPNFLGVSRFLQRIHYIVVLKLIKKFNIYGLRCIENGLSDSMDAAIDATKVISTDIARDMATLYAYIYMYLYVRSLMLLEFGVCCR